MRLGPEGSSRRSLACEIFLTGLQTVFINNTLENCVEDRLGTSPMCGQMGSNFRRERLRIWVRVLLFSVVF